MDPNLKHLLANQAGDIVDNSAVRMNRAIKTLIASSDPESRWRIDSYAKMFRDLLTVLGEEAILAFTLVGSELGVEAEKEEKSASDPRSG